MDRSTVGQEIYIPDNIEKPEDVRNQNQPTDISLPFYISSTGHYREGINFYNYHHGFNNYCFFLTLGGQGIIQHRRLSRELCAGDIIFCSNYEPTSTQSSDKEWSFCFMNIGGEYCRVYEQFWNNGGFSVIHTDRIAYYEDCLKRINRNITQPTRMSNLEINAIITEMLTTALGERRDDSPDWSEEKYPGWVSEAMAYISENFADDIRIESIAGNFFMNRAYFSRRFKYYTGKTPKEYQMYCKVDTAAMLLRNTSKTLVEISNDTGFSSQSYFIKTFREIYGQSPLKYRKNNTP